MNWIKLCFILCFCLFFSSCDELSEDSNNNKEVGSGAAQVQQTVFSKSCAEGSFKVSKSGLSSSTAISSSGLTQLEMGDSVNISGTIAKASPCYAGSVSFSCSATVAIGDNRSFVCSSGSVSGFSSATAGIVQPTVTSSTLPTGHVSTTTVRSFVSGQFHTYNNGTTAYGKITVSSPSSLVPQATCVISFICS